MDSEMFLKLSQELSQLYAKFWRPYAVSFAIANVILLAALIGTLIVLYKTLKAQAALIHHQRSTFNVSSLFDILAPQWLDREFTSTDAPEIPNPDKGGTPKVVNTVRKAKRHTENIDPKVWATTSLDPKRWENKLAYELAIALERVGIAVFAGAVSPRLLLPFVADRVLEDWILCSPWIRDFRQREKAVFAHNGDQIPWARRHAEWLALMAAIWMSRHCPDFKPLQPAIVELGGQARLEPQFRLISHAEIEAMNPLTKSEIESLLQIRL